jgi:tetratricopeptide (TPR) repeat protein
LTYLDPKNFEVSSLDENTTLPENPSTMSDLVPVHSASFNERLDPAIQLYREGMAGNVTAVQEANLLLERLRFDYPAHPLADAYHGSTMILIARDKTKPMDKLRWSSNGLKLLDKAVAAAPQDSLIRLLRGKAAYKLPEKYLHRTQTALEDYTFLIDQEISQEGIIDTEEYSQLIYELGEAYYRIGRNQDAALCWRRLENQTQDPALQQLLRQNLQSLEGKPPIEDINTDSLSSMLIETTRAVGNVLQSWAEQEKEKEARGKLRNKKSRKEKGKETRHKRREKKKSRH